MRYIKVKMEQLSVMLVKSYVLNDYSDVEVLSRPVYLYCVVLSTIVLEYLM